MGTKSISARARTVPRQPADTAYQGVTAQQALHLAELELQTLREWMTIDPDTPYRDETAARLRALAERLAVTR